VFTFILRTVAHIGVFRFPLASVERTVERLFLIHPKLELAGGMVGIAGEGDLGDPRVDLIEDGFVGDIAHLIILLYDEALFIAHTTLAQRHQSIACLVGAADVAVDAFPAVFALACISFPG